MTEEHIQNMKDIIFKEYPTLIGLGLIFLVIFVLMFAIAKWSAK